MQLELEIPERLVRKLKALNALEGGMYAANIESLVVTMMEEAVNDRIFQLMGVQSGPSAKSYQVNDKPQFFAISTSPQDSSGIADGLGDDDEDIIPPETDEEALVPKKGGLTDKELEHDMDVRDPKHEAAEEAPQLPDNIRSGDVFAQVVGLPLPPEEDDQEEAHVARRRQRPKIKARVRAMTEDYDESSF